MHETSTSADGSVNGKNEGRKRVFVSGPKKRRTNSLIVALKSRKVMPSSTASPSSIPRSGAPRTLDPTGGLISSVRDQLRYAAFHLGDGTAPNGSRLLKKRSLVEMRSNPGPGGTLFVELDGTF